MASLDPRVTALRATARRFELKIHEIDPKDVIPNGDRYVVEVIDIDEKILMGQLLIVTQAEQTKPGDPMANPQVERRGVLAAVVVTKGNGHLLGLSDHPSGKDGVRDWASVPMFYDEGDVVFVDFNAKGRALQILGRECRIINQLDVLAVLPKMKLKRTEDGEWTKSE